MKPISPKPDIVMCLQMYEDDDIHTTSEIELWQNEEERTEFLLGMAIGHCLTKLTPTLSFGGLAEAVSYLRDGGNADGEQPEELDKFIDAADALIAHYSKKDKAK